MTMQAAAERCPCGGAFRAAVLCEQRRTDRWGRLRLVHGVAASVCPRCGDVLVAPRSEAAIARAMERCGAALSVTVPIPVRPKDPDRGLELVIPEERLEPRARASW